MDKSQAKQRLKQLKAEIERHRTLYHVYDQSEISDAALDSLKRELVQLEEQYPDLKTPDSPSQRVGGKPLAKFEKVTHSRRMLSLNDAFSPEELMAWLARIQKLTSTKLDDFYCELKIDGLAVSLIYHQGWLVRGATRGDGVIGEEVTQNLKTISDIPLKFTGQAGRVPAELEVRGEVYIDRQNFERINRQQQQAKQALYANPRNLAAGTIRQLDAHITAVRKLRFFAYDLIETGNSQTTLHSEKHQWLTKLGFFTEPNSVRVSNLKQIQTFLDKWSGERQRLPYGTDGAVVTINQNRLFEQLGVVGKAPRAALAYKFPAEQATTIVEDIKLQIGRTGAVTPVAILKPVLIAGSQVSRATLHNEDEIKRKDVRIGDTVIVQKAGDIIPEVVSVLKRLRPKQTKPFLFPKTLHQIKLVRPQGEAVYRLGSASHPTVVRRRLIHFVSKGALDIEGLGQERLELLLKHRLIGEEADIFKLKATDLQNLEGMGELSAQNLLRAIESSKQISLVRFLYALGIRHVGIETATTLADYIDRRKPRCSLRQAMAQLYKISALEWQTQPDIGPKVSLSLTKTLADKQFRRRVANLLAIGFKRQEVTKPKRAQRLVGLTLVITGSLEAMSRDEAKLAIKDRGGKVAESVSGKTDYVVVGTDPGSKLATAKAKQIKTLTEQQFLTMIKG